jgi:two-component system cell cycle sensor histidine kinase/response regulator CckA
VISGGADLAAAELPEDHRAHQDIVAIQQAALSATRLIEQLLAFCKRQLSPPTALDPAEELERLSPLVMSLVGRGIDVTMDTEPDCPSIILSASHFEQLVINLVANARDAMNDRGTLHVGLRTRSLEADDVAGLRPDRYVELSVADTGAGIAPDVLSHLFEPFFTTKAESGGTGLGLATCYGIASQHGGQITVESELGNGTTVRVFLPMAQQPAAEQAPSAIDSSRSSAAVPSSRRPASQQTILIADDEPALLQMTTRMLETEGFLVIQAATVGEATSVLEDLTRHIDIVLTDVVLSAGGGTRLLELARRLRPDAVLRVMSAFSPEPEAVAAMQRVGARFLSKPFVRRALLDILRD